MVRSCNVLKNLFFCALYLIHWLYGLDEDIRQVYEDVNRQPIDSCVAEGQHLITGDYHSPYLIIT
jgi:aminoglycoside/choline kinase family phosphotransferase